MMNITGGSVMICLDPGRWRLASGLVMGSAAVLGKHPR